MRRLTVLVTLVCVLCPAFAAAPGFRHVPLPGAMPARGRCFTRAGDAWLYNPGRPTLYWRGTSDLLFCDDPDCTWCRDHVYGYDAGPDVPIRYR